MLLSIAIKTRDNSLIDQVNKIVDELNEMLGANEGMMGHYGYFLSGEKKPHLIPCKYCKRYDDQVKFLDSDGLKGFYHPFCHSEILRLMREELAHRMTVGVQKVEEYFVCRCPEDLQKLEEEARIYHRAPIDCATDKRSYDRRKKEAQKALKK